MCQQTVSGECLKPKVRDVLSFHHLCSHVIITAWWAERGHVVRTGENGHKRNAYRVLVGKAGGEELLGSPRLGVTV